MAVGTNDSSDDKRVVPRNITDTGAGGGETHVGCIVGKVVLVVQWLVDWLDSDQICPIFIAHASD